LNGRAFLRIQNGFTKRALCVEAGWNDQSVEPSIRALCGDWNRWCLQQKTSLGVSLGHPHRVGIYLVIRAWTTWEGNSFFRAAELIFHVSKFFWKPVQQHLVE